MSGETVGTATKVGELYELDNVNEEISESSSRNKSDFKGMEQALLSIKENNFQKEIMKRLDRIEEDKSKLTQRLISIEEDTTYQSSSYPVIKEDFQNQENKLRQLEILKKLEERFYSQQDAFSEEEISDQEDYHEESEEIQEQQKEYEE